MRSLEEVYDRVQEIPFVAEFKYDGQRAQIHASSDESGGVTIKIFSRHLEDMTDKVRLCALAYIDFIFRRNICKRSIRTSSRFSSIYSIRTRS